MAGRTELSRDTQIWGQPGSGIAGNTETAVIDMLGYESVMFIAIASATNASNHLGFRMSTASASGGMSDATGETSGLTQVSVLDVFRPTKRYVQGRYSASGATSPAVGIVAVVYGPRAEPTTQPSQTTVKRIYSPGSGTATG